MPLLLHVAAYFFTSSLPKLDQVTVPSKLVARQHRDRSTGRERERQREQKTRRDTERGDRERKKSTPSDQGREKQRGENHGAYNIQKARLICIQVSEMEPIEPVGAVQPQTRAVLVGVQSSTFRVYALVKEHPKPQTHSKGAISQSPWSPSSFNRNPVKNRSIFLIFPKRAFNKYYAL